MGKRALAVKKKSFAILMILLTLFSGVTIKIFALTTGGELREAAERQSTDRLDIGEYRGTIYDCNMKPLVNQTTRSVAAVAGGSRAAEILSRTLPREQFASAADRIAKGVPFALVVPEGLDTGGVIDVFRTPIRYEEDQCAPHVIGYTNGSGDGVTGVEKAFDDWLKGAGGEISISYQVDAYGRALAEGRQVHGVSYSEGGQGVVLTLDARVQKIAEEAAKDIGAGAVVVEEVSTGDIKAMVSMPGFSVTNVGAALGDKSSPLVNRALTAYNAGSVFKLITAAAALEKGISSDLAFDCKGFTTVAGRSFRCSNERGHGMMDMEDALAQSCNHYFINLAQRVGAKPLREMAERFGLGRRLELAPGMYAAGGSLPDERSLSAPHALANFSFGQGDLMVTPVQICSVIQAIANGGDALPASLVKRTVGRDGQTVADYAEKTHTPVISLRTARLLQKYMIRCVQSGTGRPGTPTVGGAGAKTGTAETGWKKENGASVAQAWYAGFYPAENPRYAIVVLTEDGNGGGSTSGPVFGAIANGIADLE